MVRCRRKCVTTINAKLIYRSCSESPVSRCPFITAGSDQLDQPTSSWNCLPVPVGLNWPPWYCGTVSVSTNQPTWKCPSGSVSRMSYGNSEILSGLIAPTGAITITLTFTAFNTEERSDMLAVESCTTRTCSESTTLLSDYSGSSIPSPIVSNTGFMLIRWVSDQGVTSSGWSAEWSSQVVFTTGTCARKDRLLLRSFDLNFWIFTWLNYSYPIIAIWAIIVSSCLAVYIRNKWMLPWFTRCTVVSQMNRNILTLFKAGSSSCTACQSGSYSATPGEIWDFSFAFMVSFLSFTTENKCMKAVWDHRKYKTN